LAESVRRRDSLLRERDEASQRVEQRRRPFPLPPVFSSRSQALQTPRERSPQVLSPLPPLPPSGRVRERLFELVNRFKDEWKLDAVLSQINQVLVEDRPTGEVLVLLPWEAFARPLAGIEAAERHRTRLEAWRQALEEYQWLLQDEVELLELRLRGWIGVHQLWQSRSDGSAGNDAWNEYLRQAHRDFDEECARLCTEIDRLQAELTALEGGPL
jgi:hypothetical protein